MVLITGANGQLGHDFQKLFDSLKVEYIATDYDTLDITDVSKVKEFISVNILENSKKLDLIINCAAYNNVDKAEIESEMCYKLNAYAPRDLAIVAKEFGADFITYSTDFVFDGQKTTPYTEEDIPTPLSVYSKAKVEGEKLVLENYDRAFVVRTSWVFGIANNNFNKQVMNWSAGKDELTIVDDQESSPTYSKDLAYYSWELLKTKKYGLYHLSNSGNATKYDQAKYLLDKIGWSGKLLRGKTPPLNLPAKRPTYSRLDISKIENLIGQKIPTWQSGMDRFLEEMKIEK